MKTNLLFIFFTFFISAQFAQNSLKTDSQKIEINFQSEVGHPKFASDDSGIIFSTPYYRGLYFYDFNSEDVKFISEENGAGYNPLLVKNKDIFYRSFSIKSGKKYYSIMSYNLNSGEYKVIEKERRSIKLPSQTSEGSLILVSDSRLLTRNIENVGSQSASSSLSVYAENNNLILFENGRTVTLNPLGKGVYVWESLSPDGMHILFTFSNRGTFICDLQGKIIRNIPDAHYPKYSPDGKFISFMIDRDNGETYTASDIYIYSIETEKTFPVTDTEDKIEMFADWSNDGTKLVYHTMAGEIYLANIQFEN